MQRAVVSAELLCRAVGNGRAQARRVHGCVTSARAAKQWCVDVATTASAGERLEHRRGRAHEAGGLHRECPLPAFGAGLQAELALVWLLYTSDAADE